MERSPVVTQSFFSTQGPVVNGFEEDLSDQRTIYLDGVPLPLCPDQPRSPPRAPWTKVHLSKARKPQGPERIPMTPGNHPVLGFDLHLFPVPSWTLTSLYLLVMHQPSVDARWFPRREGERQLNLRPFDGRQEGVGETGRNRSGEAFV